MGFCNEVMVDLIASYLHSGMGLSEKLIESRIIVSFQKYIFIIFCCTWPHKNKAGGSFTTTLSSLNSCPKKWSGSMEESRLSGHCSSKFLLEKMCSKKRAVLRGSRYGVHCITHSSCYCSLPEHLFPPLLLYSSPYLRGMF